MDELNVLQLELKPKPFLRFLRLLLPLGCQSAALVSLVLCLGCRPSPMAVLTEGPLLTTLACGSVTCCRGYLTFVLSEIRVFMLLALTYRVRTPAVMGFGSRNRPPDPTTPRVH